MPIRLIAMDMDGTLLGPAPHAIPPVNEEALRRAHAQGIQLALASGRSPDDAGFFALDAGLSMHILALNGGMTLHKPLGPIFRTCYMDEADARRVRAMLTELNLPYGVFSGHDLALCQPPDCQKGWGTFMNRPGGRTVVSRGDEAVEALMPRVSKYVVTASANPALLPPLRDRLARECPALEVTSSWFDNLEINAPGATKGKALTALADELGIPMAQVMALGDNDNDVSMLAAAGYGVAMGNASSSALAAANYVTLRNDEDGVAAAVRALVFGEEIPGFRSKQRG